MPLENILNQVFSIAKGAWPFLKTPIERTQWYQETLRKIGIPEPEHPTPDFKVVYAIALVQYRSEQEDETQWNLATRLLKEDRVVDAFRSAFSQGNYDILLGAAEKCIDELALGDEIREREIDYQRVLYGFTEKFLVVAQRSQTPAQSLLSLQSKIQHYQSQQTMAALRQEIQQLTETVTKPLPETKADEASQESLLAKQMRSWFEVLGYKFEKYEYSDKKGFEWIIQIPVRKRFDRILIRGVSGEADASDAERLEVALSEQKTDEAWLVAARRISPAAKQHCDDDRLRCLTFDELLDDDADFSAYLDWLEQEIQQRKIAERYVPLACCKDEINPKTQIPSGQSRYGEAEGWIDGCIDRWLDDPSKEHISVLGEFGTGKTWFTLHYAWKILQQYREAKHKGLARPRLPLVIPLRDYAKAIKVDNIIAGFFFTKHNIRLNAEVFDQLNRMGKLLLIFDGFDEMAARVDRQQMINQFWELAEVVKSGAKVILTCRTEHFPEAREGRKLLNAELLASTADLKGLPAPKFEVLELEKFNDEQIRKVLGFQVAELATIEKVMGNPQLLDLARRPVMTELVIEALPDIEAGKPIDLARVYLYAVQRKMQRDIKDERTFTSMADKLYFLCELSWEMLYSNQMSLNYRAFPDRLRQLFGDVVREDKTLDHWHYDMMGQSMLIRNSEGDYAPAHRSLLEFFVAYKLVAMLGVMDKDFWRVAGRPEEQVDRTIAPKVYRWKEYFQRSVDAVGKPIPMADIAGFAGEELADLYGALRDSPIAQAVLALAVPMLDRVIMRNRMLDLVRTTQHKTMPEAGYFGGNIVKMLVGREPRALERADLGQTVLQDVNFANLSLRQANLAGAILHDGRFNTVLDAVYTVAYSPDGERLAVGDDAGRIQILDARTGKVVLLWQGHQNEVNSVVYSPDGQRLASSSADETVKLWNAQSGQLELSLEGHQGRVWSLVYSPDGQRLASGSADETVKLWNAQSGQLELSLEGHQNEVNSVVYSPDGERLASGSDDKTVKLWNAQSGQLELTLEGHQGWVRSVMYSPDGKRLASSSDDETVKLWNAQSGQLELTLEGHQGRVWSLVYSPDGQRLASGSADETVKLWNAQSGQLELSLEGHQNEVDSVVYSPDGKRLASGSADNTVKLWNAESGQLELTLEGHQDRVWSVIYSPDGKRLASSSDDETVKLWNAQSGQLELTLEGHQGWVRSVMYSPDGKRLASGSDDETVKLWNVQSGQLELTLEGHQGRVWSLVYSPDGQRLASGSDDKTVKLWNAESGQLELTLESHQDRVLSVVYSPDGQRLASGSADETVKLWNAQSGQLELTLEGHQNEVNSVVYSPDGKRLASGSDDETVKLWNAQSGQLELTLEGHQGWVRSVMYSPDGKRLASGSDDKTVKLWNAESGQLELTLEGHQGRVWSLVYSPDGQRLASGSDDGTIWVWDAATGDCLAVIDSRLCGGLNITDTQGLTPAQQVALKAYGAFDQTASA